MTFLQCLVKHCNPVCEAIDGAGVSSRVTRKELAIAGGGDPSEGPRLSAAKDRLQDSAPAKKYRQSWWGGAGVAVVARGTFRPLLLRPAAFASLCCTGVPISGLCFPLLAA